MGGYNSVISDNAVRKYCINGVYVYAVPNICKHNHVSLYSCCGHLLGTYDKRYNLSPHDHFSTIASRNFSGDNVVTCSFAKVRNCSDCNTSQTLKPSQ